MKTPHILFLLSFGYLMGTTGAIASPLSGNFANTISAHNIRAMQHSLATNTIYTYEGTMAAALGNRLTLRPTRSQDTNNTYGKNPLYGQMPVYGEYNDDGSATLSGHNGGDDIFSRVHSMWANWQHFDDTEKFDHFAPIDSDYDIVTLGLASGHVQISRGISQWGIFAGYVGGTQDTGIIDITQDGGYFGIYSGYSLDSLNISAAVDLGISLNELTDGYGSSQDYTNLWTGLAAHISYNIAIDSTLTLQPELFAEYTWIRSANYTFDGNDISNDNFNTASLTPGLRAIKNIAGEWFGTASVRYVAHWQDGGTARVNNVHTQDLKSANYFEYGIGLEKSIDRFNISLQINRHDGGRTGWSGSTSLKYLF